MSDYQQKKYRRSLAAANSAMKLAMVYADDGALFTAAAKLEEAAAAFKAAGNAKNDMLREIGAQV